MPNMETSDNSNLDVNINLKYMNKKYFGDLKIDKCNNCDFSYANPMQILKFKLFL